MGLQGNQTRHHADPDDVGHNTVSGGAHFIFFAGNTVREKQDNGHLGDLRRLEGKQFAHAQPTGGIVAGNADTGDQHTNQQEDGHVQRRPRQGTEGLIIEPSDQEHGGNTQAGEGSLADEIVGGISRFIISRGEGSGKEHHQSNGGEQQHQKAKRQVDGAAGELIAFPSFFLDALFLLLTAQSFFPGHPLPGCGGRGHGHSLLSKI